MVVDVFVVNVVVIELCCCLLCVNNLVVKVVIVCIDVWFGNCVSLYVQCVLKQLVCLNLLVFLMMMIGLFLQIVEICQVCSWFKVGMLDEVGYCMVMQVEIECSVCEQELFEFDVFVYGEVECNDMVEYFGE